MQLTIFTHSALHFTALTFGLSACTAPIDDDRSDSNSEKGSSSTQPLGPETDSGTDRTNALGDPLSNTTAAGATTNNSLAATDPSTGSITGGSSSTLDPGLPSRPAGLGKLEPPDGQTLLLIGQNSPAMSDYVNSVGTPGGFMTYSSIEWNEAFSTHPDDVSDGLKDYYPWTTGYDDIVMQIGLYFRSIGAVSVVAGNWNSQLTTLGNHLKDSNVPVYLRVGYEVNVGHPDAAQYVAAYRHIVTHLDNMGVQNVAYVWHPHDTVGGNINNYYPGDEWVDWVGVSMLPNVEVTYPILDFGRNHGKPLMIAESTPAGFGVNDFNQWNGWFQLVVSAINNWDIKAFCYISQDWGTFGDEGQNGWGNTQVQANPHVLNAWNTEIGKSRYLMNGPATYALLGFSE